jgi:hypothetical protein
MLLTMTAFAQSSSSYGTRIGQVQTVYLADIPNTAGMIVSGSGRFGEAPDAARLTAAPLPKVEFETWAIHRSREFAESVVTGNTGIERSPGKATVHRFARDNFRNTNVTYTVTVEALPATQLFRLTFSDSTIPVPVPQVLRGGEQVVLNMGEDARTGRRLVEYVRVGSGVMPARLEVARNVYAEDAELALNQPHLRVNGIEQPGVEQSSEPVALSAPVVRVNIPGQGRYLVSFKPRVAEGFEQAGEAVQNSLMFWIGGNIFRIDCADRIATGSGTYNIYARRDSTANGSDDATVVTFAAQR